MVEATEIAKLRLFLKMVAVVEVDKRADNLGLDPLPDIDFNIRCGNTLVGYATEEELNKDLIEGDVFANAEFREKIEEEMHTIATAYATFKDIQLNQNKDMLAFKKAKSELKVRLATLNNMLNHRMNAYTYVPYEHWLKSHQPFHWLAEFYQIIHGNGGFDVIIGNPPYVTFTDVSLKYNVRQYSTYNTKNLFALCGERFTSLVCNNASIGYIIPLSGMSIDGFESLQNIIYSNCHSWNSYYSGDRNPSELFTGVKIRAGIYISRHQKGNGRKYVGRYIKYSAAERGILFSKINYVEIKDYISAPKVPTTIGYNILQKIRGMKTTLANKIIPEKIIYYHAAPIHWGKCLNDLSILESQDLNIADSYKVLNIKREYRDFAFILLNSSLFFFYWIVFSDCYNLTKKYFQINIPTIIDIDECKVLADALNSDLFEKMVVAEYTYKNKAIA
jgi:hypothetical protein